MLMFSARTIAAALALGAAGLVTTAAQAGVVIASSGPSAGQFPKGKKLADTDRITLKAGDSVTVLDAAGTRVISGPGTHRVGGRGEDKRSTFAVLTRQRAAQRVRTGAVRAGTTAGPAMSPNLWFVDVSKSGKMCISDSAAVQLWRPASEGAEAYQIASTSASISQQVDFEDGSTTASWNGEAMPLWDGATYAITGPGGSFKSIVTFTMLKDAPDDPETLAEALLAKGCQTQLDLLAATMAS